MSRRGLAVLVALAACAPSCASKVDAPTYEFGLFPKVAYSGFTAGTTYKVMFATGATNPTWSVGDPTIATITPSVAPTIQNVDTTGLAFAQVTILKAGQTTVTVTQGGVTPPPSQLIVTAYASDDLQVGHARYETGDATNPARVPCASCHQKPGGVDHSPLTMAGFDDDVILGVIQDGTWPASPSGESTTSAFSPTGPLVLPAGVTHTWNLTDPEKVGILAQLRSLPLGGVE